jgi:hypothetical protein
MDTILGLIGIAIWIASVVVIAAAVTYVVVKLSPGEKPAKPETTSSQP